MRSCCRAVIVRSRGFCPWPVVKPSFQFFSLSSKATNSVAAVAGLCSLWVAAVVMGFLLHGETVKNVWKRSLPTAVHGGNQRTSIVSIRLMHAGMGESLPLESVARCPAWTRDGHHPP